MALVERNPATPLTGPGMKSRRRQRGLTLIEILVAILVVSVGLLGVAGLQATSLTANRVAYARTQATILAYDMADRMRVNREAALNGEFDNGYDDNSAPNAGSQVITDQVNDWLDLIDSNLPNGEGMIDTNISGCATCVRVGIQWEDREDAATTVTFKYDTRI